MTYFCTTNDNLLKVGDLNHQCIWKMIVSVFVKSLERDVNSTRKYDPYDYMRRYRAISDLYRSSAQTHWARQQKTTTHDNSSVKKTLYTDTLLPTR